MHCNDRCYDFVLILTPFLGCPNAKDPNSASAGTGGPAPNTSFQGCDGNMYKRNNGGSIPDEVGKDHQRITNAPGTMSMANTGSPESGGSQFFINVNHNSFLDWFDNSTPSAHPVFGKVRSQPEKIRLLPCYFGRRLTPILFQVIEGYDLVEKISKVPTRNDNPVTPIQMISVRVA